ncbi:MAG: PH domain-containing protein [Longimicrobiales bacterium]|nr:PH domain-containing protein [Longimicrobiales bacterium]
MIDPVTGGDEGSREPELRPLHQRAITLWRLTTLGRGALITAVVLGGELAFDLPVPTGVLTTAAAVLAVAAAIVIPPARYRAWGFALRERDLFLRRGILFRSTSIVPHARIQHVDTRHGPVDRWLGLAGVVVFTAGHRGAIITIPALEADEAEEIRDRLAAESGVGDAV